MPEVKANNSQDSGLHLLHQVLDDFSGSMKNTFFYLVAVNRQNIIAASYSSQKNSDLNLTKGRNWNQFEQKIDWNDSPHHKGIVTTITAAYNIISCHQQDHEVPFSVYLISSLDIDFTWLNFASAAIEKAIHAEFHDATMQQKIEDTNQYTFAMMNALRIGILSVNTNGEILYANNLACRWVNIRRRDLLTIPIQKLVSQWKNIFKVVSSGEKFVNEEVAISTSDGIAKYNVSVSPIMNQAQSKLIGLVLTIRKLENVYNLVNKYTGMQARFTFNDIIAKSKVMRKLVEYAKNIANSPSTVLIEAESGTGKEVFAQSMHNASSRKDHGFVAINCAAISESLIESELFGYDDGAFTGAKKGGHPGKFELANGGTLFLDEIGDMKPELQVKLLRAIQENAITRLGGNKNRPVDVRIIAATNKNLKKEVEEGRFRLDLYYRLSVIPLRIPSLSERMEDLPSLIRFFLNKKSIHLQKNVPQLKYSTLQQFLNYNWPGNIRELENAIEQYVNLDGNIEFDQLTLNQKKVQSDELYVSDDDSKSTLLGTVKEMERQLITNTLTHFNYNVTKSAESLGISRNTLYLKAKSYNIPLVKERPII
ncbi:sigma-54 interaction domain-containing protein [Carboxylicivirga linearis]|uniref:Sigma 54-interacting transcriptional regulator n=1 Tax=Carboxylicivirga linearis TaxID=1628157 RepID=A0ABS5JQZ2_9BACT|nr:sigma 54-interacting transcriptional regulator [Carboxylicivirga linearis]MBS2097297.1 sigma 54-interacting transcriptional regulator [Carboxylicivirga linearis]